MRQSLPLALVACAQLASLQPTSGDAGGGDLLWQARFDLAGGAADLATTVVMNDRSPVQ